MNPELHVYAAEPQPVALPTPARKNIVICCDGTGNYFTAPNPEGPRDKTNGCNSNVVKLYTAVEVCNSQVAYYHPGVGTMGAPTATHWIGKEWTRIKGLAFGAGFRDNVLDAYRYLMEVYSDNGGHGNEDQVFLFGFSRGSYTVRALAGLLHGYGLLCRGNEGHLPYAWRMYADQHKQRHRQTVEPNNEFRLTFSHHNFKIHFVGVFDTVSSVGWITTPLKLFNVASNPSIVHARHAVSIDEHRCFFMDNLYEEPSEHTDMVQAWFAGVHSDVGGSYTQPEAGLAYFPLRWMLEEAKAQGLLTNSDREKLVFGKSVGPHTLLYQEPISWRLHRSLKSAWWIPELVPHIYYNKDRGEEYKRVPLGLRLRDLPGNSLVHESVRQRMEGGFPGAKPYHPRNCPKDCLQPDSTLPPAADGTSYWRFLPPLRNQNPVLLWLDRFGLTTVFWIFDLLVLLPILLFLVACVLGGTTIVAVSFILFVWYRIPGLWHPLASLWLTAMTCLTTLMRCIGSHVDKFFGWLAAQVCRL
jgi:uncharacterized protein (DUF2235 family)